MNMTFNWQKNGWPGAKVNRAALREELAAFAMALQRVKTAAEKPISQMAIANALVDEAMTTSAIEGVRVDETVIMSSICRALGMKDVPQGFTKDVRSEGVAQMMLSVRADWNKPISAGLIKAWHGALLANDPREITVGEFRAHPVQVIRRDACGEIEVVYEAPPCDRVKVEISGFVARWRRSVKGADDIALKAAMLHPHFESIHPFEDGNGRVGRALVSKVLAEGIGRPLILPVSTIVARHRKDYYEEITAASKTLDWTPWAKFFIPVLTETLNDFVSASAFVAAKAEYLKKYEPLMSERAKAAINRMFRDGLAGVAAGLSAAKWMRMTKMSKPTATRDLAELAATGAIIAENAAAQTRYRLNFPFEGSNEPMNEPIADGINDGINGEVYRLISKNPGKRVPVFMAKLELSRPTVERAIAALIKAGKIEHRGSKKTGGYWKI